MKGHLTRHSRDTQVLSKKTECFIPILLSLGKCTSFWVNLKDTNITMGSSKF